MSCGLRTSDLAQCCRWLLFPISGVNGRKHRRLHINGQVAVPTCGRGRRCKQEEGGQNLRQTGQHSTTQPFHTQEVYLADVGENLIISLSEILVRFYTETKKNCFQDLVLENPLVGWTTLGLLQQLPLRAYSHPLLSGGALSGHWVLGRLPVSTAYEHTKQYQWGTDQIYSKW